MACKPKIKRKINPFYVEQWWIKMTLFVFLMTFLPLIFHGILMGLVYTLYDFIPYFFVLTIMYGYSYYIIHIYLSIAFQKMAKENVECIMQEYVPFLPKGVEVHTLTPCRYLDTIVLDGRCKYLDTSVLDSRDWKTQVHDNEITIDNEKMQKCFHRMFDTLSYILYTSFWLYVTYAVFMICTKSFLLPVSYVVFMISN